MHCWFNINVINNVAGYPNISLKICSCSTQGPLALETVTHASLIATVTPHPMNIGDTALVFTTTIKTSLCSGDLVSICLNANQLENIH